MHHSNTLYLNIKDRNAPYEYEKLGMKVRYTAGQEAHDSLKMTNGNYFPARPQKSEQRGVYVTSDTW